jgi:pilus assembly protein CpaE
MDINMPVMDGIKATEQITMNIPESTVIIMSVQGDNEYLKKAMSAGAREFLIKPFVSEDVVNTILKTYEIESKRKEKSVVVSNDEDVKSKIITVFSTKGGVGKTTVSSNLAVSIARNTKKKVVLIDLDLQFGDIAIMLNLTVKNSISDLIKESNQIGGYTIDDYLVTHFSGLRVLPAPIRPEYAEYVTAAHIEMILKELKKEYHYILIDTSASFQEIVLTALDMSDRVLVISTLDLPTIKNVKSGLDVMDSLHYPKEKINVIVNKASEQYGIKYKDFESTIQHEIWSYVPEDSQTVITSANKGFPFVMTRTETKVAKAINGMAEELAVDKNIKLKDKSPIKKLFSLSSK